jgi:hypothetical protein
LSAAKSLEGATIPNGQKYEDWLKTSDGQDWLRKYKKNLGAYKKRIGEYKSWIQTTEGQMWRKAVEEDGENSGASQRRSERTSQNAEHAKFAELLKGEVHRESP